MSSIQQDIGIAELKKLTQVIQEKFAYDFSNYATSSFKRRIIRILEVKKLTNTEMLIKKIQDNEIKKEEFLNEVTVNVTEMFRDPSFWKFLRQVIPANFGTAGKLRIWHAGCSSGEEVYSMLILLKEANLLDKTEVYATDIDMNILKRAKEGVLSVKAMELNQENYQRSDPKGDFLSYFKKENEKMIFDKTLLSRVNFQELDLVKSPQFVKTDIILCRNVLIYFNQALQNEVLRKMHQNLSLGGFLSLGGKETISWSEIAGKFSPVNLEEKTYKKIKE